MPADPTTPAPRSIYRQMLRIRRLNRTAIRRYQWGEIGGWLFPDTGQESIAATLRSLLTADDHLITGPRCLGHALCAGVPMERLLAELAGKETGCARGRGGMMGIFAPERNFHGGINVAAAQTPLATGLAFALRYRAQPGIVTCLLGDGAVNQGCFHEALNLATLWRLPVLFIIENNGFAIGTSEARASAHPGCLAQRAEGYGLPWGLIPDASDVPQLHRDLGTHIDALRADDGPRLVEIQTYRFMGHSVADSKHKGGYRSLEELAFHKESRDPIKNLEQYLEDSGLITAGEQATWYQDAQAEAQDALAFANSSPFPAPEEMRRFVYREIDDSAGTPGRHFFG